MACFLLSVTVLAALQLVRAAPWILPVVVVVVFLLLHGDYGLLTLMAYNSTLCHLSL